jgi:hypothetical protein
MRFMTTSPAILQLGALAFGLLAAAAPASAQWSKVPAIPVTTVYSLFANADTIVAGVDTATYVSTNAGASWQLSARVAASAAAVPGAWFRNGRLYAGTFGQGVFVSDNLGTTWQAYNQGLVGGILNSQLDINDLQQRGDSLYAATAGAGVYVRGFAPADTWHHFGEEFEPNQASVVDDLALGGTRLVAAAGGNGSIFRRDPGEIEWTISWLNNVGLFPGVQVRESAWTGTGWVVGTNIGVFRSALGQEPWTFSDLGLGSLSNEAFATEGHRVFGGFSIPNAAIMEFSDDDGANWQLLESLLHAFVFRLAVVGNTLYAGRGDGLWVRSIGNVSAPPGGGVASGLQFALAGANPVEDTTRLRFDLPEAGPASIEVFDVRGRRVGPAIRESFAAGPHEITWGARDLSPGVYSAQLSAGNRHAVVRIVHVR